MVAMARRLDAIQEITESDCEMIRDSARSFAKKEAPASLVRAAEQGDWSHARRLWSRIAELDWIGLMQPAIYGQGGMPAVCVIAEELGRVAYPLPFAEVASFAVPMLSRLGSGAQEQALRNAIVAGEKIPALALPQNGFPTSVDECMAWPPGESDGGVVWIAEHLDLADVLLVPIKSGCGAALAVIERPASGWQAAPMPDLANSAWRIVDPRTLAEARSVVLGEDGTAWQDLLEGFHFLKVALCAEITGMASSALDLTVDYAKERIAFGKPIGALQAVQQRLADVFMEISAARLLVMEAAHCPEAGQVAMACIQASDAGKKATFSAQQIWAGMGYTMEVDVQLYFRRTRSRQLLLGVPWELREAVWQSAKD